MEGTDISVRLDAETLAWLAAVAKFNKRSRSNWVALTVRATLEADYSQLKPGGAAHPITKKLKAVKQ